MTHPARQLWHHVEPYHALTYFAPEAHRAYEEAGLRGFWRGYFAGRSAPLGPIGPGVVTACFFGFHPSFVSRAIPSVWSMADPATALQARLAGIDAAVRSIGEPVVDDVRCSGAAERARVALESSDVGARPLFAANLDLEWPTEPQLALWQAATLIREHRGDGHVMALIEAGLAPCEAHITQAGAAGTSLETIKPYRGWSDEDFASAAENLRARGWLTAAGRLTPSGAQGRAKLEADTDRLASDPVHRLGPEGVEEICNVLAPLASLMRKAGTIPYPNPIGVPPVDAT